MDLKIKLVNMKRAAPKPTEPSSVMGEGPRYPWGLAVNLDEESLQKLGVAQLPDVENEMILVGRVKVTRTSSSQDEGGGRHRSMELQITDMALNNGDEEQDAASTLYKG